MSPSTPERDAQLWTWVETWEQAVADLLALAGDLPESAAATPTDLPGWSVADNLAHTAHIEAVLVGRPHDDVEVPETAYVQRPMQRWTEAGVLARRGRTLAELARELEETTALRSDRLRAEPPTDPSAPAPHAPDGFDWDVATLLRNRPFDVWMHEQDIRRAVGRPGGLDSPAAHHAVAMSLASLPMVIGKRVRPGPGGGCRVEVLDAAGDVLAASTVVVGEDGRARPDDGAVPTATVRLDVEGLVVLTGGRRTPDAVAAHVDGDHEVAARLLSSLAITP